MTRLSSPEFRYELVAKLVIISYSEEKAPGNIIEFIGRPLEIRVRIWLVKMTIKLKSGSEDQIKNKNCFIIVRNSLIFQIRQ